MGDRAFLERVFHKLLLNFTWWVNRKDAEGNNVFQGGFLGLDNIGVFDRSAPLPTGGHLEQSDGTSWMAMYSLNMLAIALELARDEPGLRRRREQVLGALPLHRARDERRQLHGGDGHDLWDEEDGFFYDVLHTPDGSAMPLKIRSLVGLIPLLAVRRWSRRRSSGMEGSAGGSNGSSRTARISRGNVACHEGRPGAHERRLLAILDENR